MPSAGYMAHCRHHCNCFDHSLPHIFLFATEVHNCLVQNMNLSATKLKIIPVCLFFTNMLIKNWASLAFNVCFLTGLMLHKIVLMICLQFKMRSASNSFALVPHSPRLLAGRPLLAHSHSLPVCLDYVWSSEEGHAKRKISYILNICAVFAPAQ